MNGPELDAFGRELRHFLHRADVLSLSPEGTWMGRGSWTLAEALRQWAGNRISLVAIGSGAVPVLHVAVRLPGRDFYLDAEGVFPGRELLRKLKTPGRRDNPFFIPFDRRYFTLVGFPLDEGAAGHLARLLSREFGDYP